MSALEVTGGPLEEDGCKNKNKRSKSFEHSSFEARVDCIEFSLADGEFGLEDLEMGQKELAAQAEELAKYVAEFPTLIKTQVREAFLAMQEDVREGLTSLKEEFMKKVKHFALGWHSWRRPFANVGAAQ